MIYLLFLCVIVGLLLIIIPTDIMLYFGLATIIIVIPIMLYIGCKKLQTLERKIDKINNSENNKED